jgi:hypothetical protein
MIQQALETAFSWGLTHQGGDDVDSFRRFLLLYLANGGIFGWMGKFWMGFLDGKKGRAANIPCCKILKGHLHNDHTKKQMTC